MPMPSQIMSDPTDPIAAPRDREKAMSAAYLRLLGSSQVESAKAVGLDPRTLGRWEGCSWWADIQRAAAERWLAGVTGKARRALLDALDEPDGVLALKVLERVVPELAPPSQRLELKGTLAKLDMAKLPNWAIARIANGEHPLAVLASGEVDSAEPLKLPSGSEGEGKG